MNNSAFLSNLLKTLLIAFAVSLILLGIYTIFQWGDATASVHNTTGPTPHSDSSVIKKLTNDTANKKATSTSETTVYRTVKADECSTCNVTLRDNMLKKAYDYIVLGLILLLLVLILPGISTISFLSVFSATFREQLEAKKAMANDVANSINISTPAGSTLTNQVPVTDEQRLRLRSMMPTAELQDVTIQKYADDPQKGKWGGSDQANNRKISASVVAVSGNNRLFKITVKVISTDVTKPIRDKVVFHLQPSFPNPDPTIYVIQGEARLELTSLGAFTIGAETDGGATRLELDLAELPDAPLIFKSN